jgi:CubicO group peptidase (beta-lactamase class C family)
MRIRSLTLVVALIAVGATTLCAQQAGVTAIPDSVVSRIDRAFAGVGGAQAPGCAIGVSQNGRPVLTRAYGLANLEYGVPNTPETIFESGSVAKQFTAAAVMLLVQDGKLSLDDDIRKHLPEVPNFGKTITIRNLLTHTSGLRDQWGLLGLKGVGPGTQVHTLPLILDLVAHQKALNFDPGSEYLYSNTGYALAAIIVQRASGMPFAKFSNERLFTPLGMTNTQWRDDFTRVVKNRATAYDGNTERGFTTDMPFTNVHGNGGLLTTVGDMLKWHAFLDAPPTQVGGPSLVRALETPMILTSGKPITYALGLTVTSQGGIREVTHSGSTAGYRTWAGRYPDNGLSVAVLCNGGNANPTTLGTTAANLFLNRPPRLVQAGAVADSMRPALSAQELARYSGMFRAANPEQVFVAAVRDGKLATVYPGPRPLTPVGPHRFTIPNQGELTYRLANDKVRDAVLVNGADTTVFQPVSPATPTAAELAAYAGSYWSEELELRVTVSVRDSTLKLMRRPADEARLLPTFRDGFVSPQVGTVIFTRDARGVVNGFGVWAGRVRNVRFAREK